MVLHDISLECVVQKRKPARHGAGLCRSRNSQQPLPSKITCRGVTAWFCLTHTRRAFVALLMGWTVRPWPCLESTDDTTALLLLWCSSCPCLVLVWCSSCTTHGSLSHPIASPSHPMGWVMQQASSQWHNRTHGEKRTEVQTTRLVGGQSIKSGWMKRGGHGIQC